MRRSTFRPLGALGILLVSSAVLACSSAPPPAPRTSPQGRVTPKAEKPAPAPPSASWLPAQVVAELEDENALVYHARRGSEGLLFYTTGGRWLTRPIGAEGPKTDKPLDVGPAADVSLGALKPVGDGYLAVWVENVAKNQVIKALSLDAAGKPKGDPIAVQQIADELSWIDVLPNSQGALVLWEVPRDDKSDLFVVPMKGGKVEGAPAAIARGLLGWQAIATERGAAIATVEAPPPAPKAAKKKAASDDALDAASGKLGRVLLVEVDASGKAAAPVVLSPEPTAQVDVELVQVGGKYLVAWTDERDIDASVYLASVEPGGKVVTPPRRATTPLGEQALVSMIAAPWSPAGGASSKRALLAWEDLLRTPREGRLIHLTTLGPDGVPGRERATLVFSASGPPDLAPAGDGFAALTLAPVAAEGEAGAPASGEAPVWPSYVRFGPDLQVLASEPVRSAPFEANEGVPYLTRGLSCNADACTALASTSGAKAQLAQVSLPVRKSPWKAPAWRDPDEAPPQPASLRALFDGDHLSEVAATELPGGGALAAWVTYYLESASSIGKAGKRDEGPLATVAVRAIGADGAPGKTVTITDKALSIGGVAIATAPGDKDQKPESVVAWVGRDKGAAQVFVAKLNPDGSKQAQKVVTTVARKKRDEGPNEATDVSIASDGAGGWIVAWVDTRDGNAEVYAARLDKSLTKVVQDQRITDAPGDSAEVQVAVKGDSALFVWSDARQNADEGIGDVYVARLDPKTLKKAAPEARLFASALHSRSPQITKTDKGFVVWWIEDAIDPRADSKERGLRIAALDDKGAVVGVPELMEGEDNSPVQSAAIACQSKGCRGVLTSAVGEVLTLDAFELAPGAKPGALKSIGTLTGAVTEEVSPTFAGKDASWLFFADDAMGGSGRVRFMQLKWPEGAAKK